MSISKHEQELEDILFTEEFLRNKHKVCHKYKNVTLVYPENFFLTDINAGEIWFTKFKYYLFIPDM